MSQFTLIKPNTKLPIIPHHKPVLTALLILSVSSLVIAFVLGLNWGTSFQGGTSISMHFEQPVATEEVRKLFVDDPRFENVTVQSVGNESEYRYIVRTRTTTSLTCEKMDRYREATAQAVTKKTGGALKLDGWPACNAEVEDGIRGDFFVTFVTSQGEKTPEAPMTEEEVLKMFSKDVGMQVAVRYEENTHRYVVTPMGTQIEAVQLLNDHFGDKFDEKTGVDEVVTVGADVGDKFRADALVSILLALGLMLLYIGIRFDARYAPSAVASLGVSILMTLGFVAIAGIEITLETVAAFLSLVGYGINDTSVNFDRVRENVALASADVKLEAIVNKAINECLSRTVITSTTTIMAILPMAIMANGATQDFAIIMCVGICFTTLNSIFVSCPLLIYMDRWFKRMQERAEAKKALSGGVEDA